MAESAVNLASLIGSRICHDLISPIGAITNGLELLDLSGAQRSPEMALIADSVGNAGARIRFFRIAYGAASDQMMAPGEIAGILDDVGRGGRLSLRWSVQDPQARGDVRLAFLALQCLEAAMPFGGTIEIGCAGGQWRVAGRSEKFNRDPALWDGLTANIQPGALSPRSVQFALLPLLAAEAGRSLTVAAVSGEMVLAF